LRLAKIVPDVTEELLFAGFTLPCPTRRDGIDINAATTRAKRRAIIVREPDRDESRVCFLIRQP
jgi:hypothetical protein